MSKGKKAVIAVAVLVAVALVSGLTTMAVTNYGSQDDPLVTLSYLNETLTPAIMAKLEEMTGEKLAELEARLDELSGQGGTSTGNGTVVSGFEVLTLAKGQTVTCGVGTEIMPRLGVVVSFGPNNPRLVDETDAQSVPYADAELLVNHMYMVTIKGNGVKATKDNTKLLIRGEYTVE